MNNSGHEPDGLNGPMTGSTTKMHDDPLVQAVTSSHNEITDLKTAYVALQHTEERLRAILEHSPDAKIVVNHDNNIVFVNRNTELLFGYDGGELLGESINVLVPARYHARHGELQREYMQAPVVRSIGTKPELFALRKDGAEFPVEIMLGPLGGSDDWAVLVIVRDISERQRAAKVIRELNAGMERRVQERTAELAAANKELEAYSYSVSHDLRAPLRHIDSFSRILVDEYADKLDDEGRRLLNVITSSTQLMGRLIDDLLSFARTSHQEMVMGPVNLNVLAERTWHEVMELGPARAIRFILQPLPVVHGDRSMLQRVFTNLFSNAVKFTRNCPDASVEVSAVREPERIIISIKDNGAGYDMRYAEKLFGIFQRLHPSTEFEGTGVGLALVQRVIERHGGTVWATGEVGKGATFFFSLPLHDISNEQTRS